MPSFKSLKDALTQLNPLGEFTLYIQGKRVIAWYSTKRSTWYYNEY